MYSHMRPSGKSLMNYVALLWLDLGAGVFSSYSKSMEWEFDSWQGQV